ncbi:MAG: DUF3394 domain-containing protein, partial [Rhizobium rhizophilum]
IGSWPQIAGAFVTATCGIVLFAAGLHGYFITVASHWQRVLLCAGGLLLIDPGFATDTAGAVLAAIVILSQWYARRQSAGKPADTTPA